jgi:3'(2'), 5'-bisphosphate nucleotidase
MSEGSSGAVSVRRPGAGAAQDAVLARDLAVEAGRVLLEVRAGPARGADLKAAGDRAAHELLARRLSSSRPGDAVLSEEGDPAAGPPGRPGRVWIVDPLDGTREFSEPGRTDWAVHVALWQDGELVAGAVALPALGECYSTDDPPPAPAPAPGPLRLAVSRSRPPAFVGALAQELGAVLVPLGSAGVKCSAVWRGLADAYVHAGGQYVWDSAAPVAVARAAGLHTSRVDGSPLAYDPALPWMPDLVVCRPDVAAALLPVLAGLGSADEGGSSPGRTGRDADGDADRNAGQGERVAAVQETR